MGTGCAHDGKIALFATGACMPAVVTCMDCTTSWPEEDAPIEVLDRLRLILVRIIGDRSAQAN